MATKFYFSDLTLQQLEDKFVALTPQQDILFYA
jgi:hypothetical protein